MRSFSKKRCATIFMNILIPREAKQIEAYLYWINNYNCHFNLEQFFSSSLLEENERKKRRETFNWDLL